MEALWHMGNRDSYHEVDGTNLLALRSQSFHLPTVLLFLESVSVVETTFASLPEFNFLWYDSISAPEARPGYILTVESGGQACDIVLDCLAVRDRGTLR